MCFLTNYICKPKIFKNLPISLIIKTVLLKELACVVIADSDDAGISMR